MNALRRRLHPLTWFALVALLGLAVLPTLAHALAFAQGESRNWAEVCTPQGVRLVALEAGDEAPPVSATGHLEHCPFCSGGADGPALPAAPAATLPRLPAGSSWPARFLQAPHTAFAWASASPRGPPTTS